MKTSKALCLGLVVIAAFLAPSFAHAEEVTYELENVILDDGNVPMFGTFTWVYDVGDFENGEGQFSFLDIPYTNHDHTDLEASFDVGNSIEITLPGSAHDDGVDITLFLLQPLTPTTPSSVDLVRSRFEIGGNGFHDGYFLSGEIVPSLATSVGDDSAVAAWVSPLTAHPNPFNPHTTLSFTTTRAGTVKLSIHDSSGRHVMTLLDGVSVEAGELSRTWNGRDSEGLDAASGIYFARLVAADVVITRKLVLLR